MQSVLVKSYVLDALNCHETTQKRKLTEDEDNSSNEESEEEESEQEEDENNSGIASLKAEDDSDMKFDSPTKNKSETFEEDMSSKELTPKTLDLFKNEKHPNNLNKSD